MSAPPRTSQKQRDFVKEPMGNKPVTALAGIGEEYGERLASKGYDKASSVLGIYLVNNRDEARFKSWLTTNCAATPNYAKTCYNCIDQWANTFI